MTQINEHNKKVCKILAESYRKLKWLLV